MRPLQAASAFATLLFAVVAYYAATQTPHSLSPEGCRMSYMWPSYIRQVNFNESWTRLSKRYSLWLYREVNWESHEHLHGTPVLFIPGNAGSSQQIRSIASSATRQYFASPHVVGPEFQSRSARPLDFFAVEFNEDLSALHGPTLLAEQQYASDAIKYILSLYSSGTKIILMAHSMGGIVAMSLLPSSSIAAVVTMSTPHRLPPARFDRRIEDIYASSLAAAWNDSTPVLSLCGGAHDLMIPSESCVLPLSNHGVQGFRRTMFSTGMEGVWTSIGHQQIVWCHQLRWRVARAALEIAGDMSNRAVAAVFSRWFRHQVDVDSQSLVPHLDLSATEHHYTESGAPFALRPLPARHTVYLMPLFTHELSQLVLFAQGTTVAGLGPHRLASKTNVHVYHCTENGDPIEPPDCIPLRAQTLMLMPNPSWDHVFPLARQGQGKEGGVDESDGVVLFRADMPPSRRKSWIAVSADEGGGDQWLIASLAPTAPPKVVIPTFPWQTTQVVLDPSRLASDVFVANLIPNALLAYRVQPTVVGSCQSAALAPLLLHTSSAAEAHFHPLSPMRRILLHSHNSGPFMDSHETRGINLTVYSSRDCGITELNIEVDWWASLGRAAIRYWTAVASWGTGLVAVLITLSWRTWQRTGRFPAVQESMELATLNALKALPALTAVSLVPLGAKWYLGSKGDPAFVLIAPIVAILSLGYAVLAHRVLAALTWTLSWLQPRKATQLDTHLTFGRAASMLFMLALVALFIPYQVAYLVSFLLFLWSCTFTTVAPSEVMAQKEHALLLLFMVLPLNAPVLAVWIKTLWTAGWSAPFDGDHNIFMVVSFIVLANYSSVNPGGPLVDSTSSSGWAKAMTAAILGALIIHPIALGTRWTFGVFEVTNVFVGWLVLLRCATWLRRT